MHEPSDAAQRIAAHYSPPDLAKRILDGLSAAGKDVQHINPDDLAPVDQFHVGGRTATLALMKLAGIGEGWSVLDIGGGLGGSARVLARQLRCQVTVLDLSREFCDTGAMLCERMDLAGKVHFRQGNALDLPFDNEKFDAVWTQHSTMNIEDKGRLYDEAFRVLRPGGRLAMHEVVAGPEQPLRFPVPWAEDPSTSFLLPQAEFRALVARFGFRELAWQDQTEQALAWFKRVAPAPVPPGTLPPLGLELILGENTPAALANQVRNTAEGRTQVIQAAFERPPR